MPTFRHGKKTAVLFGNYNLSSYLNEASMSSSSETSETTAFGDDAKTYITSLQDATVSLSGMFEGEVNDTTLNNALTNTSSTLVTICTTGLVAGEPCFFGVSRSNSYDISSPVADVVTVTSDLQLDGGISAGKIISGGVLVASGATANSTVNDNTASSANGIVANLHVTDNTGNGSTTFKLQHSSDNSTFADLITFTVVSAGTEASEQKSATGTINRYLRVNAVDTGTTGAITYSLAISRR
jgi:hypothetical protein